MRKSLARLFTPTVFLAHICALTIVLIFGIAIGLSAPHLPAIEGLIRPIVSASLIPSAITRDAVKGVCYAMQIHKLRAGDPIIYQFAIEVRQNEHWLAPDNVNAHIFDEASGQPRDDYENHFVGQSWRRRWCFSLPKSVSAWQVVRVSGYAVHRSHPLWETDSPVPSFVVLGAQAAPP